MRVNRDAYNRVVLVAGSCWLLVCGSLMVVRMARRVHGIWPRRPLRAAVQVCGKLLPWRARAEASPFVRQAAKELEKRRLERAHWLIPWGLVAGFLHMASIVSRTAVTLDKGLESSALAESLDPRFASISIMHDFVVFAVTLQVFLIWAMPCLVTIKTLDVWYSGMMAGLVVWISPVSIEADLVMEYGIGVWIIALSFSLFNLELYMNLIWLVILNTMASVTILFGERTSEVPRNRQPIHEVVGLTVSSIMIAMVLHGMNYFVSQLVRLELEASMSRNELVAARSVLRGVCDVVVELDESFRLQGECLHLADMLLLNPQRTISCEDIRAFLHSDQDREKFTEQMRRAALPDSDGAGLCAAFNVRMKDGAGTPLDVEAFAVRFVDPEGQQMFFMGIREFTDTNPMLKDQEHSDEVLRMDSFGGRRSGPAAAPPPEGRPPSATQAHVEGAWELTVGETESSLMSSVETEAAMALWFDCLSPYYRVMSSSTAMKISMGLSEKDDSDAFLLPWIRTDQQEEFIQWVQSERFSLSVDGGSMPARIGASVVYKDSLSLSPPNLRRYNMAVAATVMLDLTQSFSAQGTGAPKCKNGCAMEKADKTPSADMHYRCDLCGGESRQGHRQGSVQRWKCEPCNYDLCFDCHGETQDVIRLVLSDLSWVSRKSHKRRSAGTPHDAAPAGRLKWATHL